MPISDIAHLDTQAGKVHQLEYQRALDVLFQHLLEASAEPVRPAVVFDADHAERNLLKVRPRRLEKDISRIGLQNPGGCQQTKPGQDKAQHDTSIHPAISPTRNTISTS